MLKEWGAEASLSFVKRKVGKKMEITRETMLSEIIENCPEAMPAFQAIGMHCMGCALASGENVEQACAAHGVDPDEFLEALKTYLESL